MLTKGMRIGGDDEMVVAAVKTPLMPKPTTARMPARLSLRQAIDQLRQETPKDAHAARVIEQLTRATDGLQRVDPETTTLADVAMPREIRTDNGFETIRVAAWELQSYARVGR
ncbi:MAG: hypothetical protein HYV60_12795 [Planctomycetia bacterium]|nr:hypothetical protein [Planctomycetia bacterium]